MTEVDADAVRGANHYPPCVTPGSTRGPASSSSVEQTPLAGHQTIRSSLIAGEGTKILSDDTLVELLQANGFDIARRTVAKYREAMGIGSSVQRRRARALGG